MNFFTVLNENIAYITLGLSAFSLILFILFIIVLVKTSKLKQRLNTFLSAKSENKDIETMLNEYQEGVRNINDKYNFIVSNINKINERLHLCVQKVGVIRYNPFDEVGGDLSFAVALLDEDDNGVVFNSIYSREASYTYAKPLINGVCEKYKLSEEELQAIQKALGSNNINK